MRIFFLTICLPLFSCANWQQNADKTLIWAHQAAKQQSQVAEPFFRMKCGAVAKNCKISGVSCKTDNECRKKCPTLVTCQDERHAVNKAIISVHIAVLGGRQLLVVGEEKAVLDAIATVISVVQTMRTLSLKYGLFGNVLDTKIAATQPTLQPTGVKQ